MNEFYQRMKELNFKSLGAFPIIFVLFLILPFASMAADIKLEAESATLNGVSTATSTTGYSGSGYAWGFDNGTDNVTFTFDAPAGQYELSIGYISPYGDKGYGLDVNAAASNKTFTGTGAAFSTTIAGKYQLVNGQNTIKITNGWGYFGIDYIKLTPVVTNILLEAENATLTGVGVATTYTGFSGTGYAWGFDNSNDNVTFNFSAPAGEYELSVVYNSPYGDKKTAMLFNGVASEQEFKNTNGTFNTLVVGKFKLTGSSNTIKFTSHWGYYAIDYIILKPVTSAPIVPVPLVNGRAEAELGVFNGVDRATTIPGYSGSGYVTSFDNSTDKLTINFISSAGLYDLTIGYASPSGPKGYNMVVNSETASGMFENTGNAFNTANAGKFYFREGLNTITITRGWGYFNIDYIQLTPSVVVLPAKPPKQLVDAGATPATRSLFSYLVDMYGTKVISAQQENNELTEIAFIKTHSGKEVAIGAYDLIEYSPSRIEHGSKPNNYSEKAIAWAKKDEGRGIVSLMWHWNAPTDLINKAPDKLWWSGFYTRATTFDLAAALADKTSERYKLLIRDIDVIAVQLKKFQAENIPVLWRPLHEAAGTWFWWGAKGPEAYKELWHIMYDRLTNHHQLHNLIWVYTAERGKPEWYPGDEYVDIVGIDIYENGTTASSMSGQWAELQSLYGGKKLVSLSETGNLPNPDYIRAYGTWWSYFGVWSGDHVRNEPTNVINSVFNDADVITRDELPDWRVYGLPTVSLTTPANDAQYLVCESPVLTAQAADAEGSVVQVNILATNTLANITVKLSDNTPADGFKCEWKGATPGTYMVVAEAIDNEGNTNLSAPVSIRINADVQAPVIILTSTKAVVVAEDHLLKTFVLSDIVSSVTDNCGTVKVVRIKRVSSDEAVNGNGSGNTVEDIIISADGESVQIRAERAGTGNGRVYIIEIEAIDQYGNTELASYQVQVPKGSKTAIADAPAYWVHGNYATTAAGMATAKETTSIFEEDVTNVRVYPNPVTGNQLNIQMFSDRKQNVSFILLNSNAQQMAGIRQALNTGNNQINFPVSNVPGGIYWLKILKGNEQYTKKVIVIK